jgi:hypothetical protein
MGSVEIKLMDVAKVNKMNEAFDLQGVKTGKLYLSLSLKKV